ncbi:MAG: alpha-L-rhamnosidase, partial [Chitinophagaceae bacterium]
AEYRALETEIKKTFVSNFIAEDGTLFKSSQTGYALAFNLDLVPEALHDKVAAKFKTEIERFNYHPTVGFIGVPHLLPALQKAGLGNEAHRLLLQKGNPSWLYMVDTGKSNTIWERWDSWTPEKGFVKGMNSLNHVVWGSMGEFLYSGIGGITASTPGYKKIHIEPLIGKGITWAKTSYSSLNGLIKTDWKLKGNKFELKVSIPPNTTAEVVLPGTKEKKEIGSGDYFFEVSM